MNDTLPAVWARYTPLNQLPQWAILTGVKLSGWAWDPVLRRWSPLNDVRLDPSKTRLDGVCSCPIRWQTVA